jgi:hypothetical protein
MDNVVKRKNIMSGLIGIVCIVVIIVIITEFSSHTVTNKENIFSTTNNTSVMIYSGMSVADRAKYLPLTLYSGSDIVTITNNTINIATSTGEGQKTTPVTIPIDNLLFKINYTFNVNKQIEKIQFKSNPENVEMYKKLGLFNESKTAVFIYPIFTQAAYGDNGFYDYYSKLCDSQCLTVNIPNVIIPSYNTGFRAAVSLEILNYSSITDIDVDKNPGILKNYDEVILLHNEYVTKREFDAITSHPHVVYLFPNALYAEVKTDYDNNTLTLIRGHGYPNPNMANGFDWKFENSQYEYDAQCDNWHFYKVSNDKMLNCYPGFRMLYDKSLLLELKN